MRATALWTIAAGRMALREEALPPPGAGELRLRALRSGVSRGTEALVLRGGVPVALHGVMRCPNQAGDFPFPVKYGYALVGVVEEGPADRVGQTCFALHPHQDRAVLPAGAALPLPAGLPPARAVLAANMETALNVVWDAGAGPGDRALVVGAGAVGCMVAALLAAIPGAEVTLTDTDPGKAALAGALGLRFAAPGDAPGGVDIAVNASGTGAGLQTAIDAAGTEAVVVEASWHGDRDATLALGGAFHPGRLTLKSSQVGRLPAARAPRWSLARRLAKALELLAMMPALDALPGTEIAFAEAPDRLPELLRSGAGGPAPALVHTNDTD